MEASEALPIEWTTDKILRMLGINTQRARNGIQEDMLTKPERIGHLNDEDAKEIQAACREYFNRTLTNGRFVFMRIHFTKEKWKIAFHHFTTVKWWR